MDKKQWYKLLGKDLIEGDISAKHLSKDNLNEVMSADKVATKLRSYLLHIADDIAAVTDLLDQNESEEMKEILFGAIPDKEPKKSDFVDAFLALDVMAAGKVAKFYRHFASNLK